MEDSNNIFIYDEFLVFPSLFIESNIKDNIHKNKKIYTNRKKAKIKLDWNLSLKNLLKKDYKINNIVRVIKL